MPKKVFAKAKKFIKESFAKAGKKSMVKHFERTVYWVKQLKPGADEALLIAAFAHDVERGFRNDEYALISKSSKGFQSKEHLRHHQKQGARIIAEFLESIGASKKTVARVKKLVSRHEVGGTKDENLVKDADSISFFENNVDEFIKLWAAKTTKKKIVAKFDWMFNKITSKKAKQIAKPMYEKAVKKLGN